MRLLKILTLSLSLLLFAIIISMSYTGCKENGDPWANIKAPPYAIVDTDVVLDGSGSSDDQDHLFYEWSIKSQPDPIPPLDVVSDSTTEISSFHPTKIGNYYIQLIVWDSWRVTDDDHKNIKVVEEGTILLAVAESTDLSPVGSEVTIRGNNSFDFNNRPLVFSWQFISKPSMSNASISNPNSSNVSYLTDEPGTYIVELTVTAGNDTDTDRAEIRVYPPRLDSFDPHTGEVGDLIKISGHNFSSHIDGNFVRFNSSQATIQSVEIGSADNRDINVSVPGGASSGPITVEIVETGEIVTSSEEFIVTGPDFSIDIPPSFGVAQGFSVTVPIDIIRTGGHNENIDLLLENMPNNTSYVFDPDPVPGNQNSSQLIVTADYNAIPADHLNRIIRGYDDSNREKHDAFNFFLIEPFTISLEHEGITIEQGSSGTIDVYANRIGTYLEEVFLSAEGEIIGSGAALVDPAFAPNPLTTGSSTSQLTLTVGESVPPGTYPITIKGADANLEKSTILQLTVTDPAY